MTALGILEGLAVAIGVGIIGGLGGMVVETVAALVNKDRRANIKERGFWESARHMLS